MKRPSVIILLSLIIFLIALLFAAFNFSFAQESPVKANKKPFGGRILTTTACNTGFWITVGPPRAGSFMVMPTTLQYGSKVYRPGAWAMGIALSPAPEKSSGSSSEAELIGENALTGGTGSSIGGAGTKKGNIPCIVGAVKTGEGEPVILIGASK